MVTELEPWNCFLCCGCMQDAAYVQRFQLAMGAVVSMDPEADLVTIDTVQKVSVPDILRQTVFFPLCTECFNTVMHWLMHMSWYRSQGL